jgi:uncharacterized delta-60 repeat protein
MKASILSALTLLAALPWSATANDIIYQTGFEPPTFTADQPVQYQDGWLSYWYGNAQPIMVSTENPRDGTQCLRFKSVNTTCFRPILTETAGNPPLRLEVRADVRLDGPQTGTGGTPEEDILSANLMAVGSLPNGNVLTLGGFFVSSAGRIWAFTPGEFGSVYYYSVPVTFGAYHSLVLRVDFFALTVTYVVDGVELGSTPFRWAAVMSEQVYAGYLELAGPNNPINTPEISYDPNNYTAYFDNFSVEALPATPADTDVRFAATDYAGEEAGGAVNVKVSRRGYWDSAVSVTLNTADGSTVAGRDYLTVSTPIAFAPGEREKVVQIPILNDGLVEADEVVNLSLTPSTPGFTISRPTAPLWVLDDERAGSAQPGFQLDYQSLGITMLYEVPAIVPVANSQFLAQVVGGDDVGNYIARLARFNGDGSRDPGFEPYEVFPYGIPPQVVPMNGGRRVLVNHGDRLRILHANGKEDSAFQASIEGGWWFITDVAVQPDQKIIIVGSFDTVNGVARKNIARLHVTGEVDASFDAGESTDDLIWDAALQPDGKIALIGWFQNVAGQPRAQIARLHGNGALDAGFDPGAGFGESFFGWPDLVTVAAQSDGKILVGGFFDSYQGETHHSLVRLMPDGSVDGSFDLGAGFLSSGYVSWPDLTFYPNYPGRVSGLALQPDGKVLVVGNYVYVNGAFAPGIVRLNPDGALDPAFRLGGTDSFAIPQPRYVPPVAGGPALALLPDGDILTYFYNYISVTKTEPVTYEGVVRLNGDPLPAVRPRQNAD